MVKKRRPQFSRLRTDATVFKVNNGDHSFKVKKQRPEFSRLRTEATVFKVKKGGHSFQV